MTYTDEQKQRMDRASLIVSTASLAVAAAALCFNEKGEKDSMSTTDATPDMQYKIAKQANKDANRERKAAKLNAKAEKAKKQTSIRQYAGSIGYDGPIIMLNEKEYGLVPLEKAPEPKAWVAMEINPKTGKDRQAIVCRSREEAKKRAIAMKNAHKSGSKQCKDCQQGYARMDTTERIDVKKWFDGKAGTLYRV